MFLANLVLQTAVMTPNMIYLSRNSASLRTEQPTTRKFQCSFLERRDLVPSVDIIFYLLKLFIYNLNLTLQN